MHPDDLERHAENLDRLADRVPPGKSDSRQLVVDHRDMGAGGIFERREIPARDDVAAVDLEVRTG